MPTSDLAVPALPLAAPREAARPWNHASAGSHAALIPSSLVHAAVTAAPLILADAAAMLLALGLSWAATTLLWPAAMVEWKSLAAALFCSLLFVAPAVGLYPGIGLGPVAELRRAGMVAACIGPTFLVVSLLQPTKSLAVQIVIVVVSLALIPALALMRRGVRRAFGRYAWWGQPCLITGDVAAAEQIHGYLTSSPGVGLRPLGFIGDRSNARANDSMRHLAPASRLRSTLRKLEYPWLIVASTDDLPSVLNRLPDDSQAQVLVSRLVGTSSAWHRASECLDWPGQGNGMGIPVSFRRLKGALDAVLALALAIALAPLMLMIAAMIKLTSPGPVIFKQERVGFEGRRFLCWKFRTMVCDGQRVLEEYLSAHPACREQWDRDHKLQYDPRVTSIGRLLRKTSLDELPQLWNVLRGEMSLVGPRPILASEIPDFGKEFEAFCSVMPGITGMWQVSGRNQTTYAEHVELDAFYARNWSLWLDVHILMLTFKVVLLRKGAC